MTLNPALDKTVTIPAFAVGGVNRIERMRLDPGGKGINVSKVIAALGWRSIAMGILGGAAGRYIKTCLDQMGIENDFVFVKEETRTNLKIIDPERKTNTDINERGMPAKGRTMRRMLERLKARVTSGDTVVLAGKAPPGVSDEVYLDWAVQLKALGAKVCMDADGPLLFHGIKAGPEIIKPNEEEFSRLVGKPLVSLEETARAAVELNCRGIRQIAVSMGAKGALFVKDGRVLYAHGLKVPVKSTVGAGDATMAAMVLGEERGESWEDTIRLAIAAGAASVMCEGTEAASAKVVQELIQQVNMEEFIL